MLFRVVRLIVTYAGTIRNRLLNLVAVDLNLFLRCYVFRFAKGGLYLPEIAASTYWYELKLIILLATISFCDVRDFIDDRVFLNGFIIYPAWCCPLSLIPLLLT